MQSETEPNGGQTVPRRRLSPFLLMTGGILLGLVWFMREPIRARITETAILKNEAPSPDAVEEMIRAASDPVVAIERAWRTGKIIHREVAIRQISRMLSPGQSLPPPLESILLSGTLDPDMNVREAAFSTLRAREHPDLAALAVVQLQDPDPQVRVLGLESLKQADPRTGIHAVIPLLEEKDPFIITMALKVLEKWSGTNFGVKLSDTVAVQNETTGLNESREGSLEKARAGAQMAKTWWAENSTRYPASKIEIPQAAISSRAPIPAGDFSLPDLEGATVRLKELRGRVVLLNFWTTWCTACVGEMPELIELQKRHSNEVAIIGVSLDFVPDSHGHIGGHVAGEQHPEGTEHHDHDAREDSLQKIREKVARTARMRKVNYTVLLDEKNEIGGKFNGGELPTTVIIDANGKVRRRFVGARTLPVFEAMIKEAMRPDSERQ